MRFEVRSVVDLRSTNNALLLIAAAILTHAKVIKEGNIHMANNFSALTAAIDAVLGGIQEVAAAIANPAVDKNDQATIDALTAKLTTAAAALQSAVVAENAEDGATTTADPADGSGSGDVTP
jgi:hypothetical protein